MSDILKPEEIYLQDVVYSVVSSHKDMDDLQLYNLVIQMVDTNSFENVKKILELIRLNKILLTPWREDSVLRQVNDSLPKGNGFSDMLIWR